eukprot:4153074-Karenia_brevis.AAC.1
MARSVTRHVNSLGLFLDKSSRHGRMALDTTRMSQGKLQSTLCSAVRQKTMPVHLPTSRGPRLLGTRADFRFACATWSHRRTSSRRRGSHGVDRDPRGRPYI